MIDRDHKLPLRRQAAVLQLSRSTLYYEPRPVPAAELAVMRRIDELHLDYPFAGSRMMRDLLRGEDIVIGRERVATMMRRMGIEALYRRPNTSKPAAGHKIYPYLLRSLDVVRPNQVWAMGCLLAGTRQLTHQPAPPSNTRQDWPKSSSVNPNRLEHVHQQSSCVFPRL